MNPKTIVVASACCFFSAVGWAQDNRDRITHAVDEPKIDLIFREFGKSTPGVAVTVTCHEKVIFQRSYGCSNLESGKLIDSTTVFSLASVSKQFTGFALLLLESEGKLSLEDDVRKYIPELHDYGTRITLHHLANHTSGLRSHKQLLGMKGLNPGNSITKEMVHQIIFRQKELNFEPGAEFSYSNSGYALLAEVVERVSGMEFPEYIRQKILTPLNMMDSYVVADFRKPVKNLATAYNFTGSSYASVPSNDSIVGSTGLFTTTNDLSKWIVNFDRPKVGDQRIFNGMKEPGVLNDSQSTVYGMGQFFGEHQNTQMIYHAGADAGFVSFVTRFPEHELSVMLLGNCSSIDTQRLSLKVAEQFLPSIDSEAARVKENPPHVRLTENQLERHSGRYFDSRNNIAREISVGGSYLMYSRPEQAGRTSPLAPLGEDVFQLDGAENVTVAFSNNGTARTMNVNVDGNIVERYVEHSYELSSEAALRDYAGKYFSEELETGYLIEIRDKRVFAIVPVVGSIEVNEIKLGGFCAQGAPFNYLEFARHQDGRIAGFRISSDWAKNVFFKKR